MRRLITVILYLVAALKWLLCLGGRRGLPQAAGPLQHHDPGWMRPVAILTALALALGVSVAPAPVAAAAPCTGLNPSLVGGRSNVASGAVLQASASFNKVNPALCTGSSQASLSTCWTMLMRLNGSTVADGWAQIGWIHWGVPAPPQGVPTTNAVPVVQVKNINSNNPLTVYGTVIEPAGPITWKSVYSSSSGGFSFYRAGSLWATITGGNFEPNQAQYSCETKDAGDDIGGLTSGTAIKFRSVMAQFSSGGGLAPIALTKYEATPHVSAYKRLWYTNSDGSNVFDDYTSR